MAQPEVFISHSTQDRTIAGMVCQALEQKHIQCWIAPRDIPLGLNAFDSIPKGIDQCRVLVLILSATASKSEYVQRELQIALTNKKIIIPLRIEDIKLDGAVDFLLTGVQWLDAFVPPLERHVDALVSRIAAVTQADAENSDTLRRGEDPFAALKRPRRAWQPWAFAAAVVFLLAVVGTYVAVTRTKNAVPAPAVITTPAATPGTATGPVSNTPVHGFGDTPKVSQTEVRTQGKTPRATGEAASATSAGPVASAELTPEQLRSRAAVMTARKMMQEQDYVSAENYFRLASQLDPGNTAAKAGLNAARKALGEN